MIKFPKANKVKAEKYTSGLSVFKKKLVNIKLSANESALGPSPRAIREYNKVSNNLKKYPDSEGIYLKSILAKKFQLDPNRIILGAGSDQVLELICKAFLNKKDEVIVPKYSFIVYRIYSEINGAKVKYAKEKNFKISVENILSLVTKKTKIVFLANPNNPTATYLDKQSIKMLRKKLSKNILLVIDDAYFEYVKEKDYVSGIELFRNSRNVFITRTFSILYGLAGLRVGWGYASKDIIKSLNLIKTPFNVSAPALKAASAALKDIKWLKKEVNHINKWRRIMFDNFKKMKIETNKGNTNFLLINLDRVKINSKNLFQRLAKYGILIRKMNIYKIKNSLRVTIGNADENKKFINKLKQILNV